jgi:FG-GAP-like repeat
MRRLAPALLAVALFGFAFVSPPASATPAMSFSKSVIQLVDLPSLPQDYAVADLDHIDGPDIVVIGHHGELAVLLNQGNGNFAAPAYLDSPCAISANSVVVGEFSGDANPDILVACDNNVSDGFQRFRGNGDGTFAEPDKLAPIGPSFGGGSTIEWLHLASFGGEGQAVVYTQFFGPSAELLCFFRVPDLIADYDGNGPHLPLCSAQLDPIGNVIDLITIDAGDYALGTPPFTWPDQAAFTFLPDGNLGALVYSEDAPLPFVAGPNVEEYLPAHPLAYPSVADAGDLDGDGVPEVIALTGEYDFAVYTIEPSEADLPGFRRIADPAVVATDPALGHPTDAVVGDFDGDGKRDVAVLADVGDGDTATIAVFPGNGDGTFRSAQDFPTDSGDGRLTVVDLDGAGLPDLVNLNRAANVVTILLNGTPAPEPGPLGAAVAATAALAVRAARRAGRSSDRDA